MDDSPATPCSIGHGTLREAVVMRSETISSKPVVRAWLAQYWAEVSRFVGERDGRRSLALCGTALLSLVAYVYVLSAGTFTKWPSYNAYSDLLAEGFRAGHLYLAQQPSPELLAKPNPLDPANLSLWLWDASLYRGRFYMYWGPVPGALLAFAKVVLRIDQPVGDEVVTFIFATGRLVFGALLLELVGRRVFPRAPIWLVAIGSLVFLLGNPMPFVLARGSVYEVAIMSGQCFLIGGLYFALRALVFSRNVLLSCGLASVCWVLAGGSRGSLLPATWILCALTLVALRFVPVRPRLWRTALALGLPLVVGAALLAFYNYARFGDFFETGMNHQMSMRHFDSQLLYAPANLYSYLFRGLAYDCRFPYVAAPWYPGAAGIAPWLAVLPGYWVSEPVAGALNSCPWVLFGIFAVLALRREPDEPWAARVFCVVAFTIASALTLLPALGMWMATMRFLLDVMSGATLLGAIGAFALWGRLAARPRWMRLLLVAPVIGVAVFSIGVGVLLGFQGYYEHFAKHNPALLQRLQTSLSFRCK